jgi:nitronate monooxygenase
MLGIEVPILAAPMGFISGPALGAVVRRLPALASSRSARTLLLYAERDSSPAVSNAQAFGVNVLLSGPHLAFSVEATVDVCLEERVPVLSTFWGDPTPSRGRLQLV